MQALLSDVEGKSYTFNVSSHGGQSSSIYTFGDHQDLWPDIKFTNTIELTSTTLARLLEESHHSTAEFDALVMDVQGAELLVLMGAGELLNHLRFYSSGGCRLRCISRSMHPGHAFELPGRKRFSTPPKGSFRMEERCWSLLQCPLQASYLITGAGD